MKNHRSLDRQASRTRNSLRRALLSLSQEKNYDTITIQEIVDRANVGRTTFYAHFRDKGDLLAGRNRQGESFLDRSSPSADAPDALSVVGLFRHVAANAHLFPSLRSTQGMQVVEKAFRQFLDRRWINFLEQQRPELTESERVRRARFLTGGLITWMFDWLWEGMPQSPEELDERFAPLAVAVLRGDATPER